MKLDKYSCLCFMLLWVFTSCSDKDLRFSEIESSMQTLNINQSTSAVRALFIVPNAGCDGCITNAETFIMDNIEQSQFLQIIFTGTNSQKSLKLKIGESIYNHNQVFIDRDNIFYNSSLFTAYPTIAYLDRGKVVEIQYVSPENPEALSNLLTILNEKYEPND